jgi:hypothetical protein
MGKKPEESFRESGKSFTKSPNYSARWFSYRRRRRGEGFKKKEKQVRRHACMDTRFTSPKFSFSRLPDSRERRGQISRRRRRRRRRRRWWRSQGKKASTKGRRAKEE